MNEIYFDHDIHMGHLFYAGDLICHGNLIVDGDVAITGRLVVLKDLKIGGDCGVDSFYCKGNIDIGGHLFCNNFSCSSENVKIGYSIN